MSNLHADLKGPQTPEFVLFFSGHAFYITKILHAYGPTTRTTEMILMFQKTNLN